jgi:hypothetical protein
MISRDRSFPHPVLTPFRDDVMPNRFALALSISSDADRFYLDLSFDYSNDTLAALTHDGRAVHAVHIECRHNFYRELFSFRNPRERIVIDSAQLKGRVEVSGFILARAAIESYRVAGCHSDYREETFSIAAGDPLAVSHSVEFDAYVDYDPLTKISSILTVRRSDDTEEGPMKADTSGDRIIAILSQRDYQRYVDLKGDPSLGPLLANQIVIPVLLEATREIRETSEDEFEIEMSKRWFRSIQKKLTDLRLSVREPSTSPLDAVQALLQLPLRRSLEGLIGILPQDDQS